MTISACVTRIIEDQDMPTIHTGNRRARRRQDGPILGRRRLKGGTIIDTRRMRGGYFTTIIPSNVSPLVRELRNRHLDAGRTQASEERPVVQPARMPTGPYDMKAMFRNPDDVEIVIIGQPLPSPMHPRMKRQLRALGMDMSAIR